MAFLLRHKLLLIFLIFALGAIGLVSFTYWKEFRGVWPVLTPVSYDIAEEIDAYERGDVRVGEFPLQIPTDFSMGVFARDLGMVRDIEFDSEGRILASIPKEGRVVVMEDVDGDGHAEEVRTLLSGLDNPHGLLPFCDEEACYLLVAEEERVVRYIYVHSGPAVFDPVELVRLPKGGRHTTRTLARVPFSSETFLVSIGSTCDVCEEPNPLHGSVQLFSLEGGDLIPYSQGLRNAVFMTNHPETDQVWVTEMGRDRLGDDLPPDEINIMREGGNFGWPICYGQNVHDTVFDTKTYIQNPCNDRDVIPSLIDLPAHSAPLGLDFLSGEGWGEKYDGDLIVAYHGSWNRTTPTGYKLVRITFGDNGKYLATEDFVSGWLTSDYQTLGRPVDVLSSEKGEIYISDDKAGVIYKMTYTGKNSDTPRDAVGESGDNKRVLLECKRAGCSGQICTDEEGVFTTCEWREEYACYGDAICERGANGKCGWRETEELKRCVAEKR